MRLNWPAPPKQLPRRRAYLVAIAVTLAAIGLGIALKGLTGGETRAFTLLTLAIALATWFGGIGPGLVATLLGVSLGEVFILEPSLGLHWHSVFTVVIFTAVAVTISSLFEGLKQSRIAEQRLQTSLAEKDDFVGFVSHELRNPATTILGDIAALKRRATEVLDRETAEIIDDASSSVERLVEILDSLLLLSRIDHGGVIETVPVRLDLEVKRAVKEFETRHDRPVIVECLPGLPFVCADPSLLRIVIDNLLVNADKYSPDASSQIEIEVRPADCSGAVLVRDRGIGVNEDEAEAIFSPFYRSPAAASRVAGFGLGLPVSRRVLELQGGKVWARPREGGGSEFGFSLPALKPEAVS